MRYLIGFLGILLAVVGVMLAGTDVSGQHWWLVPLSGLSMFLFGGYLLSRFLSDSFD